MKKLLVILFFIVSYTINSANAGGWTNGTFTLTYSDCNSIISNNFITSTKTNYENIKCYYLKNDDYQMLMTDSKNNKYNIPFEKDVISKLASINLMGGSKFVKIYGGITGGYDILGITDKVMSLEFITNINIDEVSFRNYPLLNGACVEPSSGLDCGKYNNLMKTLDGVANGIIVEKDVNRIEKILSRINIIKNNGKIKKYSNSAFILEYLEYRFNKYLSESDVDTDDNFIKSIIGN